MDLFPPEIRKIMPAFYSGEDKPAGEAIPILKLFTPDSNWTWYATEAQAHVEHADGSITDEPADYQGEGKILDYTFFGLVMGHETELGYFCLSELKKARGSLGLPIERDLYWTPKPLNKIAPEKFEHEVSATT